MSVLAASALLAYVQGEAGEDEVEAALVRGAFCGATSWSEAARRVHARGGRWDLARALLMSFNLEVVAVTRDDAEHAALMDEPSIALTLGDRLCLALGHRLDREVLAADEHWVGLAGVRLIR